MSDLIGNANSDNFSSLIAGGICIVDFWAPWCGPCRMQTPILEELAQEFNGKCTIVKVNIDEAMEIAREFGIEAIPTLILFKDGKEMQRFVSVQPKAVLSKAISSAN